MRRSGGSAPESDADELTVERLDRTYWRLSDASDDADSPRLLGFIERIGRHRYEVLWMTDPIAWAYLGSFDLAVEALTDRDRFAGIIEPERDKSVPSGRTNRLHRVHHRT